MQSIQARSLTTEELLRIVHTEGYENLPSQWVQELAERLQHYYDLVETDDLK